MADNYTETSLTVTMRDADERRAVLDMLNDLRHMFGPEGVLDSVDEYEFRTDDELRNRLYRRMDVEECGIGFLAYADGMTDIWFHGEEYVNVEQLGTFLGFVVEHFDMDPVSFTWADYCSKPRVGEQGGGACVVTKDEIYWMTTYSWVYDKLREIQQKTD